MSGWHRFAWRGEPIHDIRAWAAARGERMVTVRETTKYLSAVTLREHVEVEEIEMPESFAFNMATHEGGPGRSVRREIL